MAEIKKGKKLSVLACLILLVVFVGVVWSAVRWWTVSPNLDRNGYQAVFLEGNQQYFGHLRNITTRYPYISDVYYVRQEGPSDPQNPASNKFTLMKFGNEIHGPKDVIYLNKDKILFWENLRDDSQVVQGIAREKAQRAAGVTAPVQQQQQATAPVAQPTPAAVPAAALAPKPAPVRK